MFLLVQLGTGTRKLFGVSKIVFLRTECCFFFEKNDKMHGNVVVLVVVVIIQVGPEVIKKEMQTRPKQPNNKIGKF